MADAFILGLMVGTCGIAIIGLLFLAVRGIVRWVGSVNELLRWEFPRVKDLVFANAKHIHELETTKNG